MLNSGGGSGNVDPSGDGIKKEANPFDLDNFALHTLKLPLDKLPLFKNVMIASFNKVAALELANKQLTDENKLLNSEKILLIGERDYLKFWFKLLRVGVYVQVLILLAYYYYFGLH